MLASTVYLAEAPAAGASGASAGGTDADQIPTERLNAMPPVLRRQLLGPYVLGMLFLLRGRPEAVSSGFPKDDVNAAWDNAPKSSEQILHPEKYWDPAKRDDPVRVTIPDPGRVLGKHWKRAGSGILGELTIGGLVGVGAPDAGQLDRPASDWTNAAASGWGGDRYEVWMRGSASIALLGTIWDTERDAEEFEQALPHGRAGFWSKRRGLRVGVVAGSAATPSAALLDLLVAP
jgi:hypothetical protein